MTAPADLRAFDGVRVAVLGASGFVGRWVARALCQHGAELTLPVRDPVAAAAVFARWEVRGSVVPVDLDDLAALEKTLSEVQPAAVFNLAGYGVDPGERDEATTWRINGQLPGQLSQIVARVRDPGWRHLALVHAGTALEYGEERGDLDEEGSVHATTLYGKSKLAGTHEVSQHAGDLSLRALTARLFTVYGPGEHAGRLLPSLLAARDNEDDLPLTSGEQKRDFTYVEDVAQALLRLALSDAAPGTVVNCATGELTSVRAFTETAARVLGIAAARLRFGEIETRPWEMSHMPVAHRRLRQLTGWPLPTHIETGIQKTLRFATPA